MPPEWAPHEATWLSWPDHPKHWRAAESVRRVFDRIIEAIAEGEYVHLLVRNRDRERAVRARFRSLPRVLEKIRFYFVRTGDVWVRDYGPTFVMRRPGGQKGAVAWSFNAWGGKYEDLVTDGAAAAKIAAFRNARLFKPGIVLEGGAIEVNGAGVAMTTKQCLLHPNRNPGLSQTAAAEALRNYLGVRKVLWLEGGIVGDDTDGHIDEVARFVGPRTIFACVTDECRNPNFGVLRRNLETIRRSTDARGEEWTVVPLPLPRIQGRRGRPAAASYANFYVSNAAVLVPQFGAPEDRAAVRTIGRFFGGRRVVPIMCKPLIEGFGGIHCVTQQEPETTGRGKR